MWMFFSGGIEMWFADLIGGMVVFLLGLAVVFFSRQLPYMSEYGPGPGFFPLWIGLGIVGCAIVVNINILKKQDRTGVFFKPLTKLGVKVLILMIIAFLFFPLLGFSVGLGLFVGVTMRVMGKHRWISCGITAVVTAISIHFIFGHWLSIPLPTGMVGW
jgi:putative tricarboxylic transport membrane protein